MPNKMTLKAVREALSSGVDRVGYSPKDECFVAKRFYFYSSQGGGSAEALASLVRKALPGATVLSVDNHWHAWPKDSWFEVRFTA